MTSARTSEASLAVYLINLDRASDRFAAMQSQLERACLRFQRVPAIDGRVLDIQRSDFDERAFRFKHGRRCNPAEVGCFLSHIECARRLLASNREYALILEDDLVFPDDFADVVTAALKQNGKWDILRLSTVSSGRKFSFSRLTAGRGLAVALTREKGSGAYMINRRAAAWFVDALVPMQLPFDLAFDLEFLVGLRSAFVFPVPVDQQLGLPSQIQGQRRRFHRSRAHYLTVMPYRTFIETARFLTRLMHLLANLIGDRDDRPFRTLDGEGPHGIPVGDHPARRIGETS